MATKISANVQYTIKMVIMVKHSSSKQLTTSTYYSFEAVASHQYGVDVSKMKSDESKHFKPLL